MQLNSVVEVISPLFLTVHTYPENNTEIKYFTT
jgi:S-adenosylmethionine/arginine decarboxylase-like enzyme